MIEVILMERIERLGKLGDVVRVRPGFARNYLLPRKKALRATETNRAFFAQKRAEIESTSNAKKAEADKQAATLEGKKLVIIRQASETGQLFGSVNARDVAADLTAAGNSVDKTQIQIDTPIKTLGLFTVKVRLHPEVTLKISVNVARSQEEAEVQEKTGRAIGKAAEIEAEAVEAPAPQEAKEAAAE